MTRELGGPRNWSGALEIWKTSCIFHETNLNSLAIWPVAYSLWYPNCTNLPTFQRTLPPYSDTYMKTFCTECIQYIFHRNIMNYVHLKSSKFPSGLLRYKFPFLGALAKLWKVNTSIMSIHVEQLGSHWMNFHEIWYLGIFWKSVEKVQVSSKIGQE
jgi:hypothetical protein